jgi:hypothetical protein
MVQAYTTSDEREVTISDFGSAGGSAHSVRRRSHRSFRTHLRRFDAADLEALDLLRKMQTASAPPQQ